MDDDEVEAREGLVLCHIVDLPFAKPPFRAQRTKFATDEETHLDVANVHCSIYPEAPEQIDRLEQTFKALAEAPVEQRSCPRGPPRPITVARLMRAAKKEGLPLLHDARCIEPGVVAQASTLLPYKLEKVSDIDLLTDIANKIAGKTLCPFGDAAAAPVQSFIKQFRGEFEAHVREGRCTLPADWRRKGEVLAGAH